MAATVSWDPNRYGSTKKVLQYDAATGNYSIADQDHNYTGVSYNFTALPTGKATTGTTTTGTTTTGTTQTQTTEAFGDVKPWWWKQQQGEDGGGGGGGVFTGYQEKKEDVQAGDHEKYFNRDQKPPLGARLRHQAANFGQSFGLSKTDREWEDVDRALAGEKDREGFIKRTTGFVTRPIKKAWKETLKPLAIKAIDYIAERPGANKSFRGVAGLYDTEIELMRKYGSVGVTDMNPTGDTRKDDAGFNIVSGAGNYNKIGTYSRRHNMLKEADNITDPAEKKIARDKIRADWEEEKNSGVENTNYGIDPSGSTDQAPAKTEPISVSVPRHISGGGNDGNQRSGNGGGQAAADKAGGSAYSSPF